MSLYQCWCILWHLDRGNFDHARLCAILPASAFAFGDALMELAFIAGAAERLKHGPQPDPSTDRRD